MKNAPRRASLSHRQPTSTPHISATSGTCSTPSLALNISTEWTCAGLIWVKRLPAPQANMWPASDTTLPSSASAKAADTSTAPPGPTTLPSTGHGAATVTNSTSTCAQSRSPDRSPLRPSSCRCRAGWSRVTCSHCRAYAQPSFSDCANSLAEPPTIWASCLLKSLLAVEPAMRCCCTTSSRAGPAT